MLIINIRLIGDVILTTPLIGLLKEAYPDAAIDLLVNRGTGEFLEKDPRVRGVIYSNGDAQSGGGRTGSGACSRCFGSRRGTGSACLGTGCSSTDGFGRRPAARVQRLPDEGQRLRQLAKRCRRRCDEGQPRSDQGDLGFDGRRQGRPGPGLQGCVGRFRRASHGDEVLSTTSAEIRTHRH